MKKANIFAAMALTLGMGAAAAGELVPNSLSDAKVGEWALYVVPNDYQQRLSVIERDKDGEDATVTVQVDNILDGEVVSTGYYSDTAGKPMTEPEPPGEGRVTKVLRDTFTLDGRQYAVSVVRVESDDPEEGDTDWWVSAEIPVFGLAKRVEDGETVMELVDYGKE